MNTLEKKLVSIARSNSQEGESIVEEVKLLLSENAAEERATLKAIGLDNDLKIAENQNAEMLIKKSHGEKLEREILKYEDIKKLCLNYRLYMKPANQFIGTIPPDLGAELTRFCKEKSIPLPGVSYSKFFVIAPPKMFRGYLSPSQVVGSAWGIARENAAERQRIKDMDPILVYELPEPGFYAVIKSWGNDFTPLRRVYGWFTKKSTMMWVNFLTNVGIIFLMAKLAIWQTSYFLTLASAAEYAKNGGGVFGWTALYVLADIAILAITLVWILNDNFMDFRSEIIRLVVRNEKGVSKRVE